MGIYKTFWLTRYQYTFNVHLDNMEQLMSSSTTIRLIIRKSWQSRKMTYTCKELVALFTKEEWEVVFKNGYPLLAASKTFESVEAAKEGRKRLDAAMRIINRNLPQEYAIVNESQYEWVVKPIL